LLFYEESSNIYVGGKAKMNFVEWNYDIDVWRPPALTKGFLHRRSLRKNELPKCV
jgi:hypothetical protein